MSIPSIGPIPIIDLNTPSATGVIPCCPDISAHVGAVWPGNSPDPSPLAELPPGPLELGVSPVAVIVKRWSGVRPVETPADIPNDDGFAPKKALTFRSTSPGAVPGMLLMFRWDDAGLVSNESRPDPPLTCPLLVVGARFWRCGSELPPVVLEFGVRPLPSGEVPERSLLLPVSISGGGP
jgi:hypothetical protein